LDPLQIIDKYGIDQLRYYLVKEVSLGNDGSISMENLKNCINNDLANNYGNLCQRVFSFTKKNCSNKIPKSTKLNSSDRKLLENLINSVPTLVKLMNNQNLNEYIKMVVNFSFDANKYFNDLEPWALKKKDPERMRTILFTIIQQIKNISILLNPIIPQATNKILSMINISSENISIDKIKDNNIFNFEKEIGDLEILFKKIENDN
jgi:methionyl-tRNA synthetase